MSFYRIIDDKLQSFKSQENAKPQVIFGVRQCGKTTSILKHAELYENMIYVNFESDQTITDYFEHCNLDPEEIIAYICLLKNVAYKGTETLIIFDEVQASNRALTSLKYFSESKNSYKIIASGSLLGAKIYRETFSFPVGKVEQHAMFPMNFREFLYAIKEERFIPIIEQAMKNKKLDEGIHQQILSFFDIYAQIGGMPEAVASYVADGNITAIGTIHKDLQNGYIVDMTKYAKATETHKIRQVYENIAAQLGKDNQKFILKYLEKGASMRKYEDSIDWLVAAHLALKVYKITCTNQPLSGQIESNQFKLFQHDIGILNSTQQYNIAELQRNDRIYLGIVMENYAAMELAITQDKLYYFDDNKKEIDFIIQLGNDVIPLEIKASNNVQAKSLQVFMEQYTPPYAIRASRKNFGYTNNIISIPLYALGFIQGPAE